MAVRWRDGAQQSDVTSWLLVDESAACRRRIQLLVVPPALSTPIARPQVCLYTGAADDAVEIGLLLAVKEYRRSCFVDGPDIQDYRKESLL